MSDSGLCLPVGGSCLWAVPAVHYRLAFAEEVHRLCADAATRPEAIAVELEPDLAAAAVAWLRELGVGTAQRSELPCMLGLHRLVVRATDADTTPSAARAALKVLFLSPTDSTVEALRCALELRVPLYGIDRDTTAEARRRSLVLPDAARAGGQVAGYVAQNAPYADQVRDAQVDGGREVVMAARLKTLLVRHRRVLFTGGLGHWLALRRGLQDPQLLPAPIEAADEVRPGDWARVIVHPRLAVRHMDLIPAATAAYQKKRRPLGSTPPCSGDVSVDLARLFEEVLGTTYQEHFCRDDPADQLNRRLEDWEARTAFEQLLLNICLVKQLWVPDLFTALQVAQGTMSPAFCERLADVLMRFGWACPHDFPALPVLVPLAGGPGVASRVAWVGQDGRRHSYPGDPGEAVGSADEPVLDGGSDERWPVKIDWQWREGPVDESLPSGDMVLTWPPIDFLLTAMSLRAGQVARTIKDDRRVEPFEGSLHDGLDIKATLRSHARGEDHLYVRAGRYRRRRKVPPEHEWEPIVWIFRLGRGRWDRLVVMGEEIQEFAPHVIDPERLRRVQRERGTVLVEQVGFGTRTDVGQAGWRTIVKGGRHSLDWRGALLYSPGHFTIVPQARRMEDTDYQRNPICTYRPYTWEGQHLLPRHAVIQLFRHRHGLDLDLEDWPTTLVRMAIPYARATVLVVAPDQFRLPPVVFAEAARRQVEVQVVPQSYFPREVLRVLARWHAVEPLVGTNGERFPEALTRVFGEEPTANRQLLPRFWWNYGLEQR